MLGHPEPAPGLGGGDSALERREGRLHEVAHDAGVMGDFVQSSLATLQCRITTAESRGWLRVSQHAQLAGTLRTVLLHNPAPLLIPPGPYLLLLAADRTGQFATVDIEQPFTGPPRLELAYSPTSVSLNLV